MYRVLFDYFVPEYTDFELMASSADDAESIARDWFKRTYPEAVDMTVSLVEEIKV